MPANLPPECRVLERKYFEAETVPEKIKALEDYHAAIPKHKGTERLRAQIKRRISKLRLELETRKKQRARMSLASGSYAVKKEGVGQVVILGASNAGKSSLMQALTNASLVINDRPFTTTKPVPGMVTFEDVQIQLLEAPALYKGASEGKGWGVQTLSLARNADGLLLLVDLSTTDPNAQLEMLLAELSGAKVRVEEGGARVSIERRDDGKIQFVCTGRYMGEMDEIRRFLVENHIHNAVVHIQGEVDLDDIALAVVTGVIDKPVIVVANKLDVDGAIVKLAKLRDRLTGRFEVVGISAKTGVGLEMLPRTVYGFLDVVRIYTKRRRQKPSTKPLIMKGGTTVGEVTRAIHSEFYKHFKYARVWGSSNYPGEKVGLNYVLKDGDVVEIRV